MGGSAEIKGGGMSKAQEIQIIREALGDHLSQIEGKCNAFSTNVRLSINQIQEMHKGLLNECEDILKKLQTQYPNSMILIEQIKKMTKGVEQVYPFEHVYGDDRILPVKEWNFFHKHMNDKDIFIKRKSFFAFKDDLLTLLSEYAKSDCLMIANSGIVIKDDEKKTSPLTHREYLLIEKYKYDAKYIPYPLAKDQKAISTGRYKKYYTVFSTNKSGCKSANLKELQKIIPYLKEYPNAKRAAENDLDNLI